MGFHFHFRELQDTAGLRDLIDFMISQDLNYPGYEEWVQRAEHELNTGYKNAILAFNDSTLVGNLVYQQHKGLPHFLELKNLRVHPRLRVRDFGRFMLRQVEVDNEELNDAIICDVRVDKPEIINFLRSCNYEIIATAPLYEQHVPEVTMLKTFKKYDKSKLILSGRKFIEKNRL